MRLISNPMCLAGLLLPVWLLVSPVAGEVFRLRDGGRIVGRLLNEDQVPRRDYTIELHGGGQITLAKDEVLERAPVRHNEAQYEKLRVECPDTVEGHWELASWCLTNHLPVQRDAHLNRILELDPDHERARRALGYTRIGGAWQIRKEVMESQGLQLYRGRYRTKQEIEILERDEKDQRTRNEWRGKLKRYSAWLDGAKYEQGRQAILAIDDPLAVGALNKHLIEDRRRAAKRLYIEALARIDTTDAIKALTLCAIEDGDEEVRLSCLDHLKKQKRPDVVAYFVRMLGDNDNAIINRAAVALAQMKEPSAIRPLIDALVTEHEYTFTVGKPGGMGASFGSGGSGLSVGAQTETRRVVKKNQAVLDALAVLSGGFNFGFDDRAWRHWYAQQTQREPLDARRD